MKSGETANYTETANYNWQWVAVTPATPDADGKQHEECADCHAVKAGSETVIPALISIKVENLTVAKPVRDVAATTAASTDSTYYVESTEWKAADGTSRIMVKPHWVDFSQCGFFLDNVQQKFTYDFA